MSKSPAFQFYPSDFYLGTDDMSAAQVGGYIRLLCKQWDKNILPFDEKTLKKWSGLSTSDLKEVLKKFVKIEAGYVNERLVKERKKQEQHKVSKSEAGKAGMAKRWGNDNNTTITENNRPKDVLLTNDNSSSSTSSSTSVSKKDTKVSKKNEAVLIMPEDVEPEVWARYLKLNEWLKANASNVLKLADQLTVYEYQKLSANMQGTEIASLLIKMHNWKNLAKNNVSVYLTILDWARREKKTLDTEAKKKEPKLNHYGFDVSRLAP
jgi:uncharacterized protein YdaU (DUF1376 family)